MLACLATILQGCNLDREPADFIDYNVSFLNMQDAAKWDNGIYSTLRGKFGGGYVLPQEAQADMLNAMLLSEPLWRLSWMDLTA